MRITPKVVLTETGLSAVAELRLAAVIVVPATVMD